VEKQWLERWEVGRTGWHEAEGNSKLKEHWRATGRRVLVPMCGKSADMKWLADQGNQVFGVELSHLAIEAFFAEQGLDYEEVLDQRQRERQAMAERGLLVQAEASALAPAEAPVRPQEEAA